MKWFFMFMLCVFVFFLIKKNPKFMLILLFIPPCFIESFVFECFISFMKHNHLDFLLYVNVSYKRRNYGTNSNFITTVSAFCCFKFIFLPKFH